MSDDLVFPEQWFPFAEDTVAATIDEPAQVPSTDDLLAYEPPPETVISMAQESVSE